MTNGSHLVYRVRRIYKKKGKADRAVEKLCVGARAEILNCLQSLISSRQLSAREEHNITYAYAREREPQEYPTCEEFYVAAPANVESKTRHGFAWFEACWAAALGANAQGKLFD
ncbi:MAG TPA: hypothetical protein PKC13_26235 [Blastocatellia bacterium]|nr:hypothetical protein [Blastocatellia bacterium]